MERKQMNKDDIKVGTEFIYSGHVYKIAGVLPLKKEDENGNSVIDNTNFILRDSNDHYHGGICINNNNGFQYYAVIMGDLFQKDILFKDCEIIKN